MEDLSPTLLDSTALVIHSSQAPEICFAHTGQQQEFKGCHESLGEYWQDKNNMDYVITQTRPSLSIVVVITTLII